MLFVQAGGLYSARWPPIQDFDTRDVRCQAAIGDAATTCDDIEDLEENFEPLVTGPFAKEKMEMKS
jgi:hypothetical protein